MEDVVAYSHADEIWHLEPLLEHSLSTDDSLSTACSKLFTTYLDSTDNCWKSTLWEMDMSSSTLQPLNHFTSEHRILGTFTHHTDHNSSSTTAIQVNSCSVVKFDWTVGEKSRVTVAENRDPNCINC